VKGTIPILASITAALVLASVVALGVPDEQARAAFPSINGKIVFVSDRDYDLYIMNADGKGDPQPLTNNPARDVLPDWQPVQ
jgi:hypothetical protein